MTWLRNPPQMKIGPAECMGCRTRVWWNGKVWREEGRGHGHAHRCPIERPTCGALMPQTRERCARMPGHKDSHRSRWVMDDTAKRRRKWAA